MDAAKLVNSLVLIWFCDSLNMDDRGDDSERAVNVMSSPSHPQGLRSVLAWRRVGRRPLPGVSAL